ncbi:hypothetical protein KAR91_11230 [Candidatus Pacearchaeota archaeon]|nr:hypothetical protein [Candidatus Pacearchaeota archaeon]
MNNVSEIVMIIYSIIVVIGSIVTVVWTLSKRPTYKYCDEVYQRKDLHETQYLVLIEKIEEVKQEIKKLKE